MTRSDTRAAAREAAKVPDIGILMGAARLAAERYAGATLADLTEEQRRGLYAEAAAMRARYLEQ